MIRWVNAQLSILPRRGANWTGNRDNGVKLGLAEANWDIWSKSSSLCCSHTDFLNVPWTCHTHLRVFALAISSAWNTLPPRTTRLAPSLSSGPDSMTLLTETFPGHPIKIAKRFFSILCVCVHAQYLCVFIFYETGENKPYKALIHHLVHGLCANINMWGPNSYMRMRVIPAHNSHGAAC